MNDHTQYLNLWNLYLYLDDLKNDFTDLAENVICKNIIFNGDACLSDPTLQHLLDLNDSENTSTGKPYLFLLKEDPLKDSSSLKNFFLDSSIWFQYLYFKSNQKLDIHVNNQLEPFLKVDNREGLKYQDRYLLTNAVEHLELSMRMMKNSYLKRGKGHYRKVEPFVFHSEGKMKNYILDGLYLRKGNAKDAENKSKLHYLLEFFSYKNRKVDGSQILKKIKICLCDDFADKILSKFSDSTQEVNDLVLAESNDISKKSIIAENFKFISDDINKELENKKIVGANVDLNKIIDIDIKLSIDELLDSNIKYDIILLDYLFSYSAKGTINERAKYGTEFFDKLDKNKDKSIILPKGYLNKHWILPISSFSDSMINELQNKGVTFTSDDIYLSKGADPITEPYLFLYELLFMINEQIKVGVGWSINWKTDLSLKKSTLSKIQELITDVEEMTHDDLENNRQRWINRFSVVSDIFSKITRLEMDAENVKVESLSDKNDVKSYENLTGSGSYLAKSLVSYLNQPENREKILILTHYRDLLYQLAFKSYQDNELIMIEYSKLKNALK